MAAASGDTYECNQQDDVTKEPTENDQLKLNLIKLEGAKQPDCDKNESAPDQSQIGHDLSEQTEQLAGARKKTSTKPEASIIDSQEHSYTQAEVEGTFTGIFCYVNLLEAIAIDNEGDHESFIEFIKQVEEREADLCKVTELSADCASLALDLAYNYTVAASYVNLMFTWDSGKEQLREEIATISLESASCMLMFACGKTKVTPQIEELLSLMQRFCLQTVIEQAQQLANISPVQTKVLNKLQKVLDGMAAGRSPSISSLDSDELIGTDNDDSEEEALEEAKEFGKAAFAYAIMENKSEMPESDTIIEDKEQTSTCTQADGGESSNLNNNAGDDDKSETVAADNKDNKTTLHGSGEAAAPADMNDICSFANCDPFKDLWKLYVDNAELIANFKLAKAKKQECLAAKPDCWKIILRLEEICAEAMSDRLEEQNIKACGHFHLLQSIISSQEISPEDRTTVIDQIYHEYEDVEEKLASDVFDCCDEDVAAAMHALNISNDEDESDDEEAGEQSKSA